ncbi:hypothetical protein ACFSKU_11290 [Pontibacter silvestris]|uniref:Uncharacterized protein n=1 Tax=Pontibacter silvestris TaxID=2305183 RepID=A0ABW4WYG7_9BACT|nr:hypothetical protein [Pontibacter silvestris]MCC9135398.1 hypothetical protein [Pontibacter silvestris]
MKPEDIDKLFKDRLDNTTPTPPADLWSRLQERIEAEMPQQDQPVMLVEPKDEKRSFMWLYSSIAAAISLVLTVGVVFYNVKTTPEVGSTLAKKEQKQDLTETPVVKQPAPKAIAQVNVERKSEKKADTQATDNANAASKVTDEVLNTKAIAETITRKPVIKTTPVTTTTDSPMVSETALAASLPTEVPEVVTPDVKPVMPASPAFAATTSDMNAEPVEIIIKRAVASQTTQPAVEEEPSGTDKKTGVAKNIFKQVKNLASGEPVELSEIVRADKISLQTQIGKQKISKVINL